MHRGAAGSTTRGRIDDVADLSGDDTSEQIALHPRDHPAGEDRDTVRHRSFTRNCDGACWAFKTGRF